MDVREKLVELLNKVQDTGVVEIQAGFGVTHGWVKNELVASHLIANGVTVQEDCKACAEATQNCIVKLQEQIAELRSVQEKKRFLLKENGDLISLDQEWISVKDMLPKLWQDIIAYDAKNQEIRLAYMTEDAWVGVRMNGKVTHWMLLPTRPKGE